MIKFFRDIRQRLLRENRFSKYLLHAIGEIVLVVVGILIALQINNWNKDQKNHAYEVKMLSEIDTQLWYYVQEPLIQAKKLADQLVSILDQEPILLQNHRSKESDRPCDIKKRKLV